MPEKKQDEGAWRNIVLSFKKGAAAAGNGIKALYHYGQDHAHYLAPILHGAIGYKLAGFTEQTSIKLSFRMNRKDVGVRDLPLAGRPGLRHTVVVFIHGMMYDEVVWISPSRGTEGFGPLMEKEVGVTPLYIRYNSGRHISQNGRELSGLLQDVVGRYGNSIESISIIGHSMGGLIAKSACHYGGQHKHKWMKKLSHMFLIGVPPGFCSPSTRFFLKSAACFNNEGNGCHVKHFIGRCD